jgi:hypothetical protein
VSTFPPLNLRYIDGDRWLITESFTFSLDGLEWVRVGAGELTDFASIPRPVKLLWPSPGGPWDLPAVLHDRLYVLPYLWHLNGASRRLTRGEVDHLFAEAMKITQTNGLTLRMMHAAVRSGGWRPWARYRREEAARRALPQCIDSK